MESFCVLKCQVHGNTDHVLCNYCNKFICSECVVEGKLRYLILAGSSENPNDAAAVGCSQGTHAKYVRIKPV